MDKIIARLKEGASIEQISREMKRAMVMTDWKPKRFYKVYRVEVGKGIETTFFCEKQKRHITI